MNIKCLKCSTINKASSQNSACSNCGHDFTLGSWRLIEDVGDSVVRRAKSYDIPEKKTKEINPYAFSFAAVVVLSMVYLFTQPEGSSSSEKVSKPIKRLSTKQIEFKSWAEENLSITYFEYPDNSDYQIWVRLTQDKYTSKNNVENIATKIGQFYKAQTGYDKLVIVTVWDWARNKVFAKGKI